MCVCVMGEHFSDLASPQNRQAGFKYHLWSPALAICSNCGQKKLTKGLCVCSRGKLSNARALVDGPQSLYFSPGSLVHLCDPLCILTS